MERTNFSWYDCFFCLTNVKGFNKKNKKIVYPKLVSAQRPILHGDELPIPKPAEDSDIMTWSESESETSDDDAGDVGGDSDYDFVPKLFSQDDLSDLIRDLDLSKQSAQLLGSRLEEKNLLQPGTHITYYRKREQEFPEFFSIQESFVYCHNVKDLITKLGLSYNPEEWRLFIDSSTKSLKAVLLFNGNQCASIPTEYSVEMET